MPSESWLYRNRVGPGLSGYGHVCRVENAVESGTPDVNYAISGQQGWLELKVIRGGEVHLEKFQLPWHQRRLRHCGGRGLWFMAMAEDGTSLHLWPSEKVLAAPRSFYRKWTVIKVQDVEPHYFAVKPFDWGHVARLLSHESEA